MQALSPSLTRTTVFTTITVLIFAALFLLIPSNSLNARPSNLRTFPAGGTLAAVGTRVASTMTALSAKVRGTAGSLTTKVKGTTGTVVTKSKGTLDAIATNVQGTFESFATKAIGTVTAVNWQRTATLPADAAVVAITDYATTVLGTTVTVKAAQGATYGTIHEVKLAGLDGAEMAAKELAISSYSAALSNGLAWVYYGNGQITGNVDIDVQNESLGAYVIAVDSTIDLNPDLAFGLAKATYPALAELNYEPHPIDNGFEWFSGESTPAIDATTRQATLTDQGVVLYVVRVSKTKVAVLAMVGRGQYAAVIPDTNQ